MIARDPQDFWAFRERTFWSFSGGIPRGRWGRAKGPRAGGVSGSRGATGPGASQEGALGQGRLRMGPGARG
eukprot:1745217-Pyramimonas_sp.AAC.1